MRLLQKAQKYEGEKMKQLTRRNFLSHFGKAALGTCAAAQMMGWNASCSGPIKDKKSESL